jgi:hypothetical protein
MHTVSSGEIGNFLTLNGKSISTFTYRLTERRVVGPSYNAPLIVVGLNQNWKDRLGQAETSGIDSKKRHYI